MNDQDCKSKKLLIGRILLSVSPSSGPFNQFQIPQSNSYDGFYSKCLTLQSTVELGSYNTYSTDGRLIRFLIKALVLIRECDILHLHHANLLPFALIAWIHKKPVCFTLGTQYYNLSLRHKAFIRIFGKFVTAYIACSSATKNSIPSNLEKRFRTIRHGVDVLACQTLRQQISKKGRIDGSYIYAGRLEKTKNVGSMIKAFMSINSHDYKKLEIAGKGGEEDSLFNLIHSPSINTESNIEMLGYLKRNDVREKLCRSSFFISLSLSDGMPIAVLEALACGCIPILIDSEPHLELRELGFKYISIKDISSGEVAKAIRNSINLKDDEKVQIRSNNLNMLELLSVDKMHRKYEDCYTQIMLG